ncbi:hypothetical protein MK852_15560 [Shewanella benthica]|uniref:hypothetical protein n=1 Tax=Shewanella benthica TaxID=43661 RepID=UPI001D0CEEAF|nr:hypothetical protein [Shewanella benthica]MCL1063529.1 hypothetical protein [Shewanella benthica]
MKNLTTMTNIKCYLLLFIFSILSACGGGGDEGSTTETSTPPPVTPPVTPPPTSTPEPTSLDDLIIDPNNVMQSVFQLAIDINIDSNKRAYFSLCDEFNGSNNTYSVNFDSCQFRGPLDEGKLTTKIKIANHQDKLIAVLWFYDASEPQFQVWQYDTGLEQQMLRIN